MGARAWVRMFFKIRLCHFWVFFDHWSSWKVSEKVNESFSRKQRNEPTDEQTSKHKQTLFSEPTIFNFSYFIPNPCNIIGPTALYPYYPIYNHWIKIWLKNSHKKREDVTTKKVKGRGVGSLAKIFTPEKKMKKRPFQEHFTTI